MSEQQDKLSVAVAQNTGKMTPLAFEAQVRGWFKEHGRKMVAMCGSKEQAVKLLTVAAGEVSKNPMLLECEIGSFTRCLLQSAEVNLFPGVMQECAYVPLRNGKTQRLEAQFWPMYQGLIKLAYQSGMVRRINADVVYEADEFNFELGATPRLKHIPFLGPRKDRGKRVCAYAVAETIYGAAEMKVISNEFVEGIRKRSPAARSGSSPWSGSEDDYDAMARKTALKQLIKVLPKSTKLMAAVHYDNQAEISEAKDATISALEIDFVGTGGKKDASATEEADKP